MRLEDGKLYCHLEWPNHHYDHNDHYDYDHDDHHDIMIMMIIIIVNFYMAKHFQGKSYPC